MVLMYKCALSGVLFVSSIKLPPLEKKPVISDFKMIRLQP